eukprot:TRINITY_DN47020_c0_g1_i1.p1 TRINITY_DN47020_c0_g1~~TRINITY_DN47020_c0_g1_i1.p1  ORF type:complete len:294 (+),score=80.27 TRINITY_DN47020_c0_g1_i1:54-884(+)
MGATGSRPPGDDTLVVLGQGRLKLCLAHRGLRDISPALAKQQFDHITAIDASSNDISELRWIRHFPQLEDLVLDSNSVKHSASFPPHPRLRLLSLNGNRIGKRDQSGEIGQGGVFAVDRIAKSYPALVFLSMIRNPGVPSYFNGSTAAECKSFRYYVIHTIPTLKFLDGSVVTDDERQRADAEFGDGDEPTAPLAVASGTPPMQCDRCGAALLLSQAPVGTKWPCPKCGEAVVVQTPEEMALTRKRSSLRRLSASSGALASSSGPPPPLPPPPAPR